MNLINFSKNPPVKLKSFKNDLAPIGFFFDIFSTEIFQIPVLPIPMRIDKITNGEHTLIILPDCNKIYHLFEKMGLYINFKLFFSEGIKNLIDFVKKKYEEITYRPLSRDLIINWFEKSLQIEAKIPSLTEDFTFLISEFLKLFSNIKKMDFNPAEKKYNEDLIQYCDNIINYFQKRIEENLIQTTNNNLIKTEQIYKEKKGKYYPQIIAIDVKNIKNNKIKRMRFIPYLIYDDLLDVFCYNKKILVENSQTAFNFNLWYNNEIIKKKSNMDKFIDKQLLKNFKLSEINLETIL